MNIEFCANKMQFAGSFAFLLSFEEKCCWKSTKAYGDYTSTCEYWFQCYKKNDFDTEDKERPGQPKFEDEKVLLDQDLNQTQELAESLNVVIDQRFWTFEGYWNDSKEIGCRMS